MSTAAVAAEPEPPAGFVVAALFTGKVGPKLPPWATGGRSISMEVAKFEDGENVATFVVSKGSS